MIGVDTNVLVYAHRADTPQFAAARSLLERLVAAGHRLAVPAPVIAEFLRVVMHPAVWEVPTSLKTAIAFVDELTTHPSVDLVLPAGDHWPLLRKLLVHATGSADVFDAQILATLVAVRARVIVTADMGMQRFADHIQPVSPLRPDAYAEVERVLA